MLFIHHRKTLPRDREFFGQYFPLVGKNWPSLIIICTILKLDWKVCATSHARVWPKARSRIPLQNTTHRCNRTDLAWCAYKYTHTYMMNWKPHLCFSVYFQLGLVLLTSCRLHTSMHHRARRPHQHDARIWEEKCQGYHHLLWRCGLSSWLVKGGSQ